jgi:4-hydroxy-tetrahydrodipicolinate synthase
MKKSTSFDPIWAPILTHYSSQKELELDSNLIEKHIKWLEPNVKQFLICGTTGDGWNLNDKLIKDWLNITIKKNLFNKQNKILFGVFGNNTHDVLKRADIIERFFIQNQCKAGFIGLTLCAPVGKNNTQKQIINHFETIIENTYLPISIYQLPQVVKCEIKPETLKYLKEKFENRIVLFKDTSGEDKVINSELNFGNIKFLRGAEGDYFNHISPNGKYDGFLLSSANNFGKILREIINKVNKDNYLEAEYLSQKLSRIINNSFNESKSLKFGNPFSNVNKAYAHVLLNKNNYKKISCKTCFDADIPKDFLEYVYSTLSEYSLVNSLR